jgi:hypothetical protein
MMGLLSACPMMDTMNHPTNELAGDLIFRPPTAPDFATRAEEEEKP